MANFPVEEIYIDLLMGRVRGKWWGSRQQRPILLVHGWQDNAGSFDTLIPLLPPEFSYLAIDVPGHGFSYQLPKGAFYHTIDLPAFYEEIRVKFKWDRLSMIAHSMGAIATFFYAAIYPNQVDLVCALDSLKMQHNNPKFTEKMYTSRTLKSIELLKNWKDKSPEYTHEEMVDRVHEGSLRSVNKDKSKYLMERGARESPNDPNKFTFTRDIRVKYIQPYYVEQVIALEYIKRIKAAYLFIKGDDRNFAEPQKNMDEAVEMFQKCNQHFEFMRVRGTHHFHLNEPELIANKIGEFLKKHHVKEVQKGNTYRLLCKL